MSAPPHPTPKHRAVPGAIGLLVAACLIALVLVISSAPQTSEPPRGVVIDGGDLVEHIRRYKRDTGAPPRTLDDLVPKYLSGTPRPPLAPELYYLYYVDRDDPSHFHLVEPISPTSRDGYPGRGYSSLTGKWHGDA